MKMLCLLTLLFLTGCVTRPEPTRAIGDQAILEAMADAPVFATEPGFEELDYWLKPARGIEWVVTEEPGAWIKPGEESLLVTVDLRGHAHASGLVHHLVVVFDPETRIRLSPVFHYSADELVKRSRHTFEGYESISYIGYKQHGPYVKIVAGQLRFDGGRLTWSPHELADREGDIAP